MLFLCYKENTKYKSIESIESNKLKKYVNDDLKNKMEKNGDIYYYFSVKTGWFKPKEIYMVNIYDKTTYILINDKVQRF